MRFTRVLRDPVKDSTAFLKVVELNKHALIEGGRSVNVTEDELQRCQRNFARYVRENTTFNHQYFNALLLINGLSSDRDFYFNRRVVHFPDEEQLERLLSRHKSTYPQWL